MNIKHFADTVVPIQDISVSSAIFGDGCEKQAKKAKPTPGG
jgi:hypothetical protein